MKIWLCILWFVVGLLIIVSGTADTFNYALVWITLIAKYLGDILQDWSDKL